MDGKKERYEDSQLPSMDKQNVIGDREGDRRTMMAHGPIRYTLLFMQ